METEKIIDDLNRRFSAPLPEFYNRRIIFWYDDEGEYLDKIDDITLSDAKVLVLTGKNNFYAKKVLCHDDTYSNYLVYRPYVIDISDENWLINIEMYSEEYRSDLISSYMNEMDIPSTVAMRKAVKEYKKFFGNKERRKKATSLITKKPISRVEHLHLVVMATLCNLGDTHPNGIAKSVIAAGLENRENSVYNDLVNFGADTAFWTMMGEATGYREDDVSVGRLASHILTTSLTRTLPSEYLIGLERFISTPHQYYCYDFISDWLRSDNNHVLYEIARVVEEELKLPQRFAKIPVSELSDTECFPCINECILTTIMNEVSDHLIEVDNIASIVEKRRTLTWYDKTENYFDGLLQVANMQSFYKEFSANFHTVEPKQVWKEYTEKFYKMDTYYRLYHRSFANSLKNSHPDLDDLFKQVTEVVEGLYTNWYLNKMGECWTKASEDELATYGYVLEVPKQVDFYKEKIMKADARTYVIISDALRYEVAATLFEQLKRESQAKITFENRQGIFPTITKFGMAALLPHKELGTEIRNDKLYVTVDGCLTDSNYREKILKTHNPESIVLKYEDIIKLKQQECKDLVRGKEVIYIYHDKIDGTSHSNEDESLHVCDEAIAEIKNLVRTITSKKFEGKRILITADHGFLYTYSPLKEDGKVESSSFKERIIAYGRRYAILNGDEQPEYLLPVKIFDGNKGIHGFAPRDSIRIKMQGGGLNFVHGGTSLQEMVIPVIEYRHLNNDTMEYKRNKQKYDTKPVSLNLISSNKKISNMLFALNFYQAEAVSDNREGATYMLYFVDSNGTQISDTQKIIADKTSNKSNERTFRINFNLKPLKYNKTEQYYLVIGVIGQENRLELPQREEFEIDMAFNPEVLGYFD